MSDRRRASLLRSWSGLPAWLSAVGLLVGFPARTLAQTAAPGSVAQALFQDASEKLDQGDFEHACPMLEKVLAMEPGANGARMALAECYEGAGRLASAVHTYMKVVEAAVQLGQTERRKKAGDRADALLPRAGGVIVQLSPAARALDPALVLDGQPFSAASLNKPYLLDKGPHVLAATATRRKRWETTVQITDGVMTSVTIDNLLDDSPPPAAKPEPAAPPAAAKPPAPPAATGPRPLSHQGQLGAYFRVDFDALSLGAVTALGASYAPHENLEIGAAALIGKRAGAELEMTCFFLSGSVKPLASLAVPVLFQGDPYVGVRGAAGVQLDVNRHFGVQVSFGAAYFPEVPAGYTHVALLPALGVQGRL